MVGVMVSPGLELVLALVSFPVWGRAGAVCLSPAPLRWTGPSWWHLKRVGAIGLVSQLWWPEHIEASVESCWERGWLVRQGVRDRAHPGDTEKGSVPSLGGRHLPVKHR